MPDLLVGSASDRLIVELKKVGKDKLRPAEKQQLLNYMELLKSPRGIPVNFPKRAATAEEPTLLTCPNYSDRISLCKFSSVRAGMT